jgi:proliferating cell nuclear antigen
MPHLLNLKTVQGNAFKLYVESLKELITEVNIEFDKDGMKIVAIDMSQTVLVHSRLEAKNFEIYELNTNRLVVGVSILNLFKLTKSITTNDTIGLQIDQDKNHLNLIIENSEKNQVTRYQLKLIDLNESEIKIPSPEFDSIITMPSSDFQKICKDMSAIAEKIEIKSVDNQLMFSCEGNFASQETIISETNSGMSFLKNNNEIIQGLYSLRYLVLFTKCTNLCNSIEMYLKNDYPLIIQYKVANLGSLKLCLAPSIEDN